VAPGLRGELREGRVLGIVFPLAELAFVLFIVFAEVKSSRSLQPRVQTHRTLTSPELFTIISLFMIS
jgi:hypothetical protein